MPTSTSQPKKSKGRRCIAPWASSIKNLDVPILRKGYGRERGTYNKMERKKHTGASKEMQAREHNLAGFPGRTHKMQSILLFKCTWERSRELEGDVGKGGHDVTCVAKQPLKTIKKIKGGTARTWAQTCTKCMLEWKEKEERVKHAMHMCFSKMQWTLGGQVLSNRNE